MSTLYAQMIAAQRQADDLATQVRRCPHVFMSAPARQVTVSVPVYDHWAGHGYSSQEAYAQRHERTCSRCGLEQAAVRLTPDQALLWVDVR